MTYVGCCHFRYAVNARIDAMKQWEEKGGILIVNYDIFRRLCEKDARTHVFLLKPGADVVVCDEGHLLKSENTKLKQFITSVATKRRIVLTGTPVQNNLLEYFTMIEFVNPALLGTKEKFIERFVKPITDGQYFDSTPIEIHMMKIRSAILNKLLDGCVHRIASKVLPHKKYEYVVYIPLTMIQVKLYQVNHQQHLCTLLPLLRSTHFT